MKPLKNVAASVRQRLLNQAKSTQRPFQEILQYYAMERFLYRLSESRHADRFILKGALMLRVWQAPGIRPTMDIDMLGKTSNDEESLVNQVLDILAEPVEDDGMSFDRSTVRCEPITKDGNYHGLRVRFVGKLDSARMNIQLDIGFGDVVHPGPERSALPTILESLPPKLLCYSRESAISEKLEAMVKLGELNSRMKDFYDIWFLSKHFSFESSQLREAIHKTFRNRNTTIPSTIDALNEPFVSQKQVQWVAFRKRLQQDQIPELFQEITTALKQFIEPILNEKEEMNWAPYGPWEHVNRR